MSTNEPRQTNAEKKEAARAAREQASQADVQAAAKKRRLWQLGGILGIAAAVIIAIVVATGSSSSTSSADLTGKPNGAAEINALFAGVPQNGNEAGNPNAKFTLVEFADLKCPVCRQFDVGAMPTIIKNYVKTGKVKIQIRLLHFVGNQDNPGDSEDAARFAEGAGLQNRMWSFVELFYFNQKDETTRYATPAYLTWLGNSIPGLNSAKAIADGKSKAITKQFATYEQQFAASGFTGTPSFLFGPTGSKLAPFQPAGDGSQPGSFTAAFDAALGK